MSLKRSDNYWKSRWLSESVALTASVVSQPSICRLAGLEGKAEQWGGGFTIAITAMNNLSCWLHRLYQILFQGLHTSAQPPFQLYLLFSPTPPSHTSSSAWALLAMASLAAFAHSSCHLATRWRGSVRRCVTSWLCSRSGTLCPLRLQLYLVQADRSASLWLGMP